MEGRDWAIADVALDTHVSIQALDQLRQESGYDPKLNRVLLKLREVFTDLNSLLPAPLEIPPREQS
jgi:hypothetical protein